MGTVLSVLIRVTAAFVLLTVAAVIAHLIRPRIPEGRIKRVLYRKFYV